VHFGALAALAAGLVRHRRVSARGTDLVRRGHRVSARAAVPGEQRPCLSNAATAPASLYASHRYPVSDHHRVRLHAAHAARAARGYPAIEATQRRALE